jgi:molybdopterin-guanine dinucleotide biosynthesis protein A
MNISAVLLAGGESRRMGQDKATLVLHGKWLWEIQLDLLRRLRPKEIFLSARSDPVWRPADVHFASDQTPSRGPLSGLAATLPRIRTGHLLALAIDMPLMTEDFLRSLSKLIKPSYGVVPMIGDRAEPLAAIYPKSADSDVIAALAGPDFSLQSLTRRLIGASKLRLVSVSENEENYFRNLNKPGDFI